METELKTKKQIRIPYHITTLVQMSIPTDEIVIPLNNPKTDAITK